MANMLRKGVEGRIDPYDFDGEPVSDLVAELNELAALVPKECVPLLVFEQGYDGDSSAIKVYYDIEETPADIEERLARDRAYREQRATEEIARAIATLQRYGVKL